MNTFKSTALALAIGVVLTACGTTPVSTSLLEQTRSDYRMAQANPKVATYAALEMQLASDALAKANVAASGKDSLATQIAQEDTAYAEQVAMAAQQKARLAEQDAALAQKQTQDAQQRTANLEAQLAAMAAKKTARGYVITLGDVLFGTDLARLNADGMRTAQKLADILRDNPQRTVGIEGFTDSTGAAAHNQELSERRAGTVSSALQGLGGGGT